MDETRSKLEDAAEDQVDDKWPFALHRPSKVISTKYQRRITGARIYAYSVTIRD